MKNKKIAPIYLLISLLLTGCGPDTGSPDEPVDPIIEDPIVEPVTHEHNPSTTWSYDDNNHWQVCKDNTCKEQINVAPHDLGEPTTVDPSTLKGEDKYKYSNPTIRKCKTCDFYIASGTNILPELRFTSDVASEISFATTATKEDLNRPEVNGKFTLSNCDSKFGFSNLTGNMKVRGNQTARWQKKAFRLKFDEKVNLLGLNNGKKFKKWVLFADAKDTALIRTAAGLYISKAICKDDENVWVSDFTPVSVYLNDQYWGYYYLAEQKEVKNGRVDLPEVSSGYAGTDIGYCFELDYYAKEESQKIDGDPTFTISYKPKSISYTIESSLANFGAINTYTMLSDITNADTQLPYIKKKVENLYTVLYEAAVNKKSKKIVNDAVVESTDSIQATITNYFDLNTWADGFIINAFDCAPDLGYSSFYMSFDNSSTGDKKLRFDVPWDFDSNFGNRNNFITKADASTSEWGRSFDPYYMDRTSNPWIQLLSKLTFFMDIVKQKWNKLVAEKVFDNLFAMMEETFSKYDAEMKRNFYRWPVNDCTDVREVFRDPSKYKDAQAETMKWCRARYNYLNNKWGTKK